MDGEDWREIQDTFLAVRELEGAARDAALAESRSHIREVIERMLAAEESPLDVEGSVLVDSAPEAHATPDRIGPYRIEARAGQGGVADVFVGRHVEGRGGRVAIKRLRAPLVGAALVERFARERLILSRLDHPDIVQLLDAGTGDDGRPYLVMEFVEGRPLLHHARERDIPLLDRWSIFARVCRAVNHAHELGIVHRDLKPTNVLATAEGRIALLDFGIAKLLEPLGDFADGLETPAGVRLLTPSHAAPEQVSGGPPTIQTDIYGLGLILYALSCDRPAFDPKGVNWLEWERIVTEDPPPTPSSRLIPTTPLPAAAIVELDRVVARALSKAPNDRHRSAEDLADEVDRLTILAASG